MVNGPVSGRIFVAKIGATAIAKGKNWRIRFRQTLVKDYSMDQEGPEVLAPGDETYEFTGEKLWIDSDFINDILAQTSTGVSLVCYPAGTASGEMTVTLGNFQFSEWTMTADKDGAIIENMAGEGKTFTVGEAT